VPIDDSEWDAPLVSPPSLDAKGTMGHRKRIVSVEIKIEDGERWQLSTPYPSLLLLESYPPGTVRAMLRLPA
jgi:hypothetical protein